MLKKLLLFGLFLYLCSCTPSSETVIVPAAPLCSSITAEISECLTDMPAPSPVTITGTAGFYKRTVKVGVSAFNLGASTTGTLPIKHAEVRILNAAGNVIQCGSTDSAGQLKSVDGVGNLQISNTAGSYTVQVLARSNHAFSIGTKPASFKLYASVKKNICSNEVHAASTTITLPASTNATIIAHAREADSAEVIGGAFNILNNLYVTYDYLNNHTSNIDLRCLDAKLSVYWQAGFNPAQYIYTDQEPIDVPNISYYLRGKNELYINGGKLGNVSTEDTDHFDDAVIIHELGHRIEDACGKMDSPGGTHFGLFRIDPRLAWSEGWGNFMAANVIKNNLAQINSEITGLGGDGWVYYLDTKGYRESAGVSGNNELIRLNLTKSGNNPESTSYVNTYHYDKVDSTNYPGEGHFREVSISRSLFKITNTCVAPCTNTDYMPQIWQGLDKITGMGQTSFAFRSSPVFYERLAATPLFGGTLPASILNVLDDEAQQIRTNVIYSNTWPAYGVKLTPNNTTPCPIKIQPERQTLTTQFEAIDDPSNSDERSDQRFSNHFYRVDKSTLNIFGVNEIKMTITQNTPTTLDFDLILFPEGYTYPNENCNSRNSSGICTSYTKNNSSQFTIADRSIASTPAMTFSKIISLNNVLISNNYLLNIRAYNPNITTSSSTEYTYQLTDSTGGVYLCPTTF